MLPKYYLTGKDEVNNLRTIEGTEEMLEMLKNQKQLQHYIFKEVGIRMQLPILIKIEAN